MSEREAGALGRAGGLWLACAVVWLASLFAPWTAQASAARLLWDWLRGEAGGTRILALGGLGLPAAVGLAALLPWLLPCLGPSARRAVGLALMGVLLPSLWLLAFSDRLPARIASELVSLPAPRPLTMWAGGSREAVRVLLLAASVLAAVCSVLPLGDGRRAPVGRWVTSLVVAAALPVWACGAEGWGARVAELSSVGMFVTATAGLLRSAPRQARIRAGALCATLLVAGVWWLRFLR